MTNHDMGPVFGFLLVGILAFFILTCISGPEGYNLLNKAIRVIDESFADNSDNVSGMFSGNSSASGSDSLPIQKGTGINR